MDRVDELLNVFALGFGTEKLLAELLALSKSGDYRIGKSADFLARHFQKIGKIAVGMGAHKIAEQSFAYAIVFHGCAGDGRITDTLGFAECLVAQMKLEFELGNTMLAIMCLHDLCGLAQASKEVMSYLFANESWMECKDKIVVAMDGILANKL